MNADWVADFLVRPEVDRGQRELRSLQVGPLGPSVVLVGGHLDPLGQQIAPAEGVVGACASWGLGAFSSFAFYVVVVAEPVVVVAETSSPFFVGGGPPA